MSFSDCIDTAVEGGELSREDGARLKRDFDRFRRRFAENSEATADAEAKRALGELLKAETAHEKRKAKLALDSIGRVAADLDGYRNAKGERDIASAAIDMLEHFGTAKFDSVEGRRKEILGRAHARLETLLHQFRRSALAGDKVRWNRARLDNVVREAFGEDTGDAAAKGLAGAWTETAEWLRQRFNAAGGAIGKLENWGLPQHHDKLALIRRGRDQWKADITPMLDPARMAHPLTGRAPGPDDLNDLLDEVYDSIVMEGWNRREPSRQRFGRGALANQRGEHRVLVFRNADDWLAYQRDYGGGGDPFAAMMGHLNMMSRDIAAMEVLGPNPDGTMEWLKQAIAKELAGKGRKADSQAAVATYRLDTVWNSIRGTLETPVNSAMAGFFGGARSLITSSVLGSAAITALSDAGTSLVARKYAGIHGRGAFADIVKSFRTATKREAVAAGLILDNAAHVFQAQARYVGTLDGPAWTQYIADRVLTYSGLTAWTQAGRHAFGLAFMETAARMAGKRFDALPDALRRTFERHGLDAAAWDTIREADKHDMGRRVMLLRQNEIAAVDEGLAEKWLGMILAETEYAIPSGSHRSRSLWVNNTRPGTLMGEAVRSMAQFKSFATVLVFLHGRRIARDMMGGQVGLGAAYAGALLMSMSLYGAMTTQLKQVASGRDPRDMTTGTFWQAAILQGGGLGIYGDFLFADLNRYGGGLAGNIGGPVVERASDLINLTIGNAAQLWQGEDTKMGREVVGFLRGNVPGGNIWYWRLAWERLALDQLQYLVDPEANKAFKRKQQFWEREFGQGFFWAPGTTAPQRAPDFVAAAGRG